MFEGLQQNPAPNNIKFYCPEIQIKSTRHVENIIQNREENQSIETNLDTTEMIK